MAVVQPLKPRSFGSQLPQPKPMPMPQPNPTMPGGQSGVPYGGSSGGYNPSLGGTSQPVPGAPAGQNQTRPGDTGIPAYTGSRPLGSIVDPTTQYGAATQAALAKQAQEAALGLQTAGFAGQAGLQGSRLAAEAAAQKAAQEAQLGLQTAGFTGQAGLQGSRLAAEAAAQKEAEAAQLGLQTAGFAGQGGLQKSQQAAEMARQQEAEGAQALFLNQQAGIQAGAEQRRMGQVQSLFGQLSGGGAGGGATLGPGGGEDAARTAAFARAKDTAGQIGRSAMTGLQNVMGGRGLQGSGLEVNQAGGVLSTGAQQLGDVNREETIQALQNARQRASEQFQGALTQRGQNISAMSPLLGLISSRAY